MSDNQYTVETWRIEPGSSRTIDIDGVHQLRVGIVGGTIDIVGHDEPAARIEIRSVTERAVEVTLDAGKLSIAHPKFRWDNLLDSLKALGGDPAKVELSILVPRHIALKHAQVSATALVSGVTGGADISTVSGEVQLDRVTGKLTVNTVNGNVEALGIDGAVGINAVTAEVVLAGRASAIDVDTVSGSFFADVTGSIDKISVNAVSGESTIRLDQGLGIRADGNTVSGMMTIDGVVLQKRGGQFVAAGEPSVRLRVNTVSGDATVVRRA